MSRVRPYVSCWLPSTTFSISGCRRGLQQRHPRPRDVARAMGVVRGVRPPRARSTSSACSTFTTMGGLLGARCTPATRVAHLEKGALLFFSRCNERPVSTGRVPQNVSGCGKVPLGGARFVLFCFCLLEKMQSQGLREQECKSNDKT